MIEVFTDGSCLGNPGNGGWAFLVNNKGVISSRSGYKLDTTNNQMELIAAIKAIEYLIDHEEINIFTDSNYVKNGITTWITNWKNNNWKTTSKNLVKNKDLWEKLDKLNHSKKIVWQWVKAHNENMYNNQVDILARNAAETLTESSFN